MTHRKKYKAPLLLRNAHLATIYPALFRNVKIDYHRKRIVTPDDDFFDVDIMKGESRNALVIIHGLEGSSQSGYMKGMAVAFNRMGWNVYAMNFRSCSGVPNKKLTSYHSGFTDDIRFFVKQLIDNHEADNIFLCGFSLGGNALLKYLVEEGTQIASQIKAAAAISVPVDLKGSAYVLSRYGNKIYMNRFLRSLKSKIIEKSKMFPGQVDLGGIEKIRDFQAFDDRYTAPIHGFKDANAYWAACSSLFVLDKIHVPTLLLNALNDPFLSASCFPLQYANGHPFVHAEFTRHGGHVGFAEKGNTYWSEKRVMEFFAPYHE